jgi:hypothetical protein
LTEEEEKKIVEEYSENKVEKELGGSQVFMMNTDQNSVMHPNKFRINAVKENEVSEIQENINN